MGLAGSLNWVIQCIYGGRFRIRFHLCHILDAVKCLDKPWHHPSVTQDEDWWRSFLYVFNGKMEMVEPRPLTTVYIDTCSTAAGGYYQGDIVYTP